MLSIANIGSSNAASSYYELDDYYHEGDPEHQGLSEWWGKGCANFGLEAGTPVEREHFRSLLEGKLPDGKQLGRIEDGEKVHAPGIDMTFSAPKSVSIMAEVGKDLRIYEAHQKAVKAALLVVEAEHIGYRQKNSGEIKHLKTDNVTIAVFRHDTSRNLDPQLHTHCVVVNAVKRNDGKMGSAFLGEIFDNKLLLGQIYRSELASAMTELGYSVERTHADGRFEIKEVPASLIDAFSSRSQEIRDALKEYTYVNAKTAANATLKTRQAKVHNVDRGNLQGAWHKVAQAHGVVVHQLIPTKDAAASQQSATKDDRDLKYPTSLSSNTVQDYIQEKWQQFLKSLGIAKEQPAIIDAASCLLYAIEHVSERASVFSKKELMEAAMSFGTGKVPYSQVITEIGRLIDTGALLTAKMPQDAGLRKQLTTKKSSNLLTTPAAITTETNTIKMMHRGKGKVQPIYTEDVIKPRLEKSSLSIDQRIAVKHLLTSADRIIGIQGYAGVGKTTMLRTAKELADEKEIELVGLSPSASAASTLQLETGIASHTIHRFIFQYAGVIEGRGTKQGRLDMEAALKNKILIVDEASLASTHLMNCLLKVVTELKTRVVLIGDNKQLGAVEAGKPFAQLQAHGMHTAKMKEIVRQKNPTLKAAVYDAIQGHIHRAFERVGTNLVESKDLAKCAAEKWISMSEEWRHKTLMTAPSNQLRHDINGLIRGHLKNEETLTGQPQLFTTLTSMGFTQAQLGDARNYDVGHVVLFNKDFRRLGIKAHSECHVITVNQRKGLVTLATPEGGRVAFEPHKATKTRKGALEVFSKEQIELQHGDVIRWTKNSKDHPEIINSQSATIERMDTQSLILKMQSGNLLTLSAQSPDLKHMDYGYVSTVHAAQGKTCTQVIGILEADHKHLTTQPSFYVTLSRAKDAAMIITNDKEKLHTTLLRQTGERVAATEHQNIKPQDIIAQLTTEDLINHGTSGTIKSINELER